MKPEQLEHLIGSLLREHGAALKLYATTWTTAPDDCLQQALIKLAATEPKPENPLAWLFRVVRNQAISQSRSENRRRQRETTAATQKSLFHVPLDGAVDTDELAKALDELPSNIREVVVAKIWGGLTFDEIGQTVDCSSSAAHRRYLTGLELLRCKLDADTEESKVKGKENTKVGSQRVKCKRNDASPTSELISKPKK